MHFSTRSFLCTLNVSICESIQSVSIRLLTYFYTEINWKKLIIFLKSVPLRHLYQYVTKFVLELEIFLDESCRKNQNPHFKLNTFSSKIVPFVRQCRKIWWSQRGHKCHSLACVACWINKATRALKPTRPVTRPPTHTRTHALTHPLARAHTQTNV